jgi:hypothetical protein
MGRGRRDEDDPPMKKPVDLLEDPKGGAELGEGGENDSYCSTQRELSFLIKDVRDPEVGESVILRIGDPVQVLSGTEEIGRLPDVEGQSMKSCIAMGYRMTGSIVSVDNAEGRGTLRISGARLEG